MILVKVWERSIQRGTYTELYGVYCEGLEVMGGCCLVLGFIARTQIIEDLSISLKTNTCIVHNMHIYIEL
jgi:hypothetical protein